MKWANLIHICYRMIFKDKVLKLVARHQNLCKKKKESKTSQMNATGHSYNVVIATSLPSLVILKLEKILATFSNGLLSVTFIF